MSGTTSPPSSLGTLLCDVLRSDLVLFEVPFPDQLGVCHREVRIRGGKQLGAIRAAGVISNPTVNLPLPTVAILAIPPYSLIGSRGNLTWTKVISFFVPLDRQIRRHIK
jgi:hypothetical protein